MEKEIQMEDDVIEIDNPYDEYDVYDIEVIETVTKVTSIFAKDEESAKKYFEDLYLDKFDMEKNIDSYEKTITVYKPDESGRSTADYTVPLWFYNDDDEEDE